MDVLADVVLVLDLFMIPIMNVIEAEKDQSPSYVDVITGQKKVTFLHILLEVFLLVAVSDSNFQLLLCCSNREAHLVCSRCLD